MIWKLLKLWRKHQVGHPFHLVCHHRSRLLRLPCLRWPTYDYRCGYHQDDETTPNRKWLNRKWVVRLLVWAGAAVAGVGIAYVASLFGGAVG